MPHEAGSTLQPEEFWEHSLNLNNKSASGRSFLARSSALAQKSFRVGVYFKFMYRLSGPINFFAALPFPQNEVVTGKMFYEGE